MTDAARPVLAPASPRSPFAARRSVVTLAAGALVALVPIVATTRLHLRLGAEQIPHDFSSELAGALAIAVAVYAILCARRARLALVPYAIAAIAVASLGVYDLVRGITAAPPPGETAASRANAIDVLHPTEHFFEAWRRGDADQILAEAHPALRDVLPAPYLRRMMDTSAVALGAYASIVETRASAEGAVVTVAGTARFERGRATFELTYLQQPGGLILTGVTVEVPEALRREGSPATAEAFAAAAVDHLIAADLAALADDLDPRIALDPPKLDAIKSLPSQLGPRPSVHLDTHVDCLVEDGGGARGRCLEYTVSGERSTVHIDLTLMWMISRWEVVTFQFVSNGR
jgi:hypothetical protein